MKHSPLDSWISLASQIIGQASRREPADRLMRRLLRDAARGHARSDRAGLGEMVSRGVFAYYRWRGWLEQEGHSGDDLGQQVKDALALQKDFERNPETFPWETLRSRVVPSWLHEQMPMPREWILSLQAAPRMWLRLQPGREESVRQELGELKSPRVDACPQAMEYLGAGDLFRTDSFEQGDFEVQDISSQVVGHLCNPQSGETWWDACAGEGGKTLHLSNLMHNKGLIWATDRAGWRLETLKRRAARAGAFNLRIRTWPEDKVLPVKTLFDGVLVDAPCSGVGTWQRNPHARWTTELQDVLELQGLQERLLERVAPRIKPGGKLIYAVCTQTRAETVEVVERFEKAFPEFEPKPWEHPFQGIPFGDGKGQIWPQDCGGNGMFAAIWKRRS